MSIPFDRLGIPAPLRKSVRADAPRSAKMAVAKGLLPTTADVQLALMYVLAVDEDKKVADTARATLLNMPLQQILSGISQATFPKIIDFIAEFRTEDGELDQRLVQIRTSPDRAMVNIARRADKPLCEALCRNHERLLMTPAVFVALYGNENCTNEHIHAAESFLRMHNSLPDVPPQRPFVAQAPPPVETPEPEEQAPAAPAHGAGEDLSSLFDSDEPGGDEEAPVPAPVAAAPQPAPTPKPPPVQAEPQQDNELEMFDLEDSGFEKDDLDDFTFDFADDMADFSWDLTVDEDEKKKVDDEEEEDQFISMERRIGNMSVGQKIKLAYLGNQEARKVLIRDSNKIVSAAVVKSGRLTPNEVTSIASNKNLAEEVLREIATSAEFTRKYPVRVALVNNPKTPVNIAIGFIGQLQKKDLQQLANNRGVPSAIFGTANKLFKAKYRK